MGKKLFISYLFLGFGFVSINCAVPEAPPVPSEFPPKIIKPEVKIQKEQKEKKAAQEKVKINNVLTVFDVSEDDDILAATSLFAFAICEQDYPIITTSHIFKNFVNNQNETIAKVLKLNWFNDLDIYKTKSEDFYLFIPKAYLKKLYSKYPDVKDENILLGFNLNQLTKVKIDDLKNIVDFKSIDIEKFKNLFLPKEKDVNGKWNFILVGHGMFSIDLLSEINKGKINQIKQLYESKFSDIDIVGIKLNQFRDLLQFFINELNTNFLYYFTCYAGGYNSLIPYITNLINKKGRVISLLKTQKPNFVVVSGAVADVPMVNFSSDDITNCLCKKGELQCQELPKDVFNFSDFFNQLIKFSENSVVPTKFKDNELKDIFQNNIPLFKDETDPFGISNLPQAMFPGTDIFRAFDVNGNIFIVTDVMAKKHNLEKKPIIIKDKRVTLIYPLNIDELIFKNDYSPAIVAATPVVSIQNIKKLDATSIEYLDFFQAINPIKMPFEKYFFIEELILKNDSYGPKDLKSEIITLKDVLIKTKNGLVSVIFSIDDDIYLFSTTLLVSDLKNIHITKKLPQKKFNIVQNPLANSLLNYYFIDFSNEIDDFNIDKILLKIIPKDVKEIFNEFIDMLKNPNDRNLQGKTALCTAVSKGNLNFIKALIQRGANKDLPNTNGFTPLICATVENQLETIKYLLSIGANPLLKNNVGASAISIAKRKGFNDILKEFVSKINLQTKTGKPEMDFAKDPEIIKLLEEMQKM